MIFAKRKSSSLIKKEDQFFKLQYETHKKRQLGPSAFVETSKLERQLLSLDKELQQIYQDRQVSKAKMEKILLKYGRNIVALLVFMFYYGVPIVTFSGGHTDGDILSLDEKISSSFYKAILFPLSVIGLGFKISRWGMEEEIKGTSIGGLVVMWTGQVTMGQIMDGIEAMVLS